MKYGLDKNYTSSTNDTFQHNGKSGVIAVKKVSGSGTITLSHSIGGSDVTIDSFTADGGAQFVSPIGELKVTSTISSGSFNVVVKPLNEH